MTFLDNPVAEAILLELRRIAGATERTAAAYEKMAKLAEHRSPAATAKPERVDAGAAPKKREKVNPEDILTVTGYVLHFGQAEDKSGQPKLTKKKKVYWQLKLTNGFVANVFSETQASTCSTAYDEQRPLIVDYVKSGDYSNIEGVRLAASAATSTQEREPGEDDSPF